MEKFLIYSAIKCPDGTILESKHVHDYVSHTDANGIIYSLDGGTDYIRQSVNTVEAEDLSLYSDAPHEKIREVVTRGSLGKDGKQPLTYIKLLDIDDEYLDALIEYETMNRPNYRYLPFYKQEKIFRKL